MALQGEKDALEGMLRGTGCLCESIRHTLGPKGRNVIFDQKNDVPMAVNCAMKIAAQLTLQDPLENLGVRMFRSAAQKVHDAAGDGTATTILLAQSIAEEGRKRIAAGANPMLLRKGLAQAAAVANAAICRAAVPVRPEMVSAIAAVAGKDPDIGKIVAEAFAATGLDGIVTVVDSQTRQTTLRHASGASFDDGLVSDYFATSPDGSAVLENPYILLVNRKLDDIRQLLPILGQIHARNASLLLVAKEVTAQVRGDLAANVVRGVLRLAVVEGPGHGDTRRRNMYALAAVTGATVVDEDGVCCLERSGLEICGRARMVVANKERTTIKEPAAIHSPQVRQMYRIVSEQLQAQTRDFEIEKLRQTIALLQGCMETIQVGGTTELAMFEQKHLFDCAVHAVYAAKDGGVLPGGGKALLLAIPAVQGLADTLSADERLGAALVLESLKAQAKQIADNAGYDGKAVVSRLLQSDDWWGFDSAAGRYGNMMELGILDSALAIRSAVLNAAGIAGVILTAGAAIT